MALDFSRTSSPTVTLSDRSSPQDDIETVEEYDIVADRQLVGSSEVDALTSQISLDNLESIVTFGATAADEISKASDVVLRSMNMSQLDESSQMLGALSKIMDQFDLNEIKDNPGVFGKWFGNAKKQLEKLKLNVK